MNCPVCNRNNAVTLSICPSCGAMINDSVREELKLNTSSSAKRVNLEKKGNMPVSNKLNQQTNFAELPKSSDLKSPSKEINSTPTTPNLVEFHPKNATIPEWRLQLQNVVRKRHSGNDAPNNNLSAERQTKLVTNGANALKAEIVEEIEPVRHKNPTLSNALERIEQSRQKFLVEDIAPVVVANSAPKPQKNYPFHIAFKQTEIVSKPAVRNTPLTVPTTKPKLATSLRIDNQPLDTNKLPPLSKVLGTSAPPAENLTKIPEATDSIEIGNLEVEEVVQSEAELVEEFDDYAPLAMRFNAGLFDFIIGSFLSVLLIAPFVLLGGSWLSLGGFFAFLVTFSIVMFIYLTASIGLFGRTFGMRIFSLELIDAENEDYPSLHQAAVSSSIYLLSVAFGGIGFLTLPFNEEKRAVHDLVSGTIIVREF